MLEYQDCLQHCLSYLRFLRNYFDGLTKLFSSLYIAKFLISISKKIIFSVCRYTEMTLAAWRSKFHKIRLSFIFNINTYILYKRSLSAPSLRRTQKRTITMTYRAWRPGSYPVPAICIAYSPASPLPTVTSRLDFAFPSPSFQPLNERTNNWVRSALTRC